ncbi:MAG: SHOCT domain-containing protein [Sulfurospirillum sp.]
MFMNGWMAHGFFMPWIFLVPVMIVLFFMMRSISCSSSGKNQEENSLDIAKKRFARGEIDEATFDKIKNKLSED